MRSFEVPQSALHIPHVPQHKMYYKHCYDVQVRQVVKTKIQTQDPTSWEILGGGVGKTPWFSDNREGVG